MVKLLVPAGRLTAAPVVVIRLLFPDSAALCPYSKARLAVADAFISALILMLFCALSVSLLADHVTSSLTLIFPTPGTAEVVLTMVTSFKAKLLASTVPVIFPPEAAMVKSTGGSISHVPFWPAAAKVVTFALSATCTCAAEVSIKPPSPPFGALASNIPPTFTVPTCMSLISSILPETICTVPFTICMVLASIIPVLFTIAVVMASAALADINT